MTVTTNQQAQPEQKMVTCTIDGIEVSVPEGTLIIRAAEQIGVAIPRFCDHPLLDPVGACRQCLVEVTDMGNGKGMPKPAASCTTTVMPGMVVKTQLTSAVADKAQQGIMEMLLMNHPLDCPVCDKGGECPLQNQAMSNGRSESRFDGPKRVYPKPLPLSPQVLLDRERCVLCARCTRFSAQIAGDAFIDLMERGALQQVGIEGDQDASRGFSSYFSGNTVQICPVGALTSTQYRFRARPFDLRSVATTCEHCAAGCALRTDVRRGQVVRRQAGVDEAVNEEWNCDKGRWAIQYARGEDRLTAPLVRDEQGMLVPTSWPDALATAAAGLRAAQEQAAATGKGLGVLTGGRLSCEDAYAYSRFARATLGTNDVDFRARPIGFDGEEEAFLAQVVAGQVVTPVTYADLEAAGTVILAGFEPEDEAPIVFLRLRKAARRRKNPLQVLSVAAWASPGSVKLNAHVVPTVAGREADVLQSLASQWPLGQAPQGPVVVLVGQRLAALPGALFAAATLARRYDAALAWVPRRAGEVGAVAAGLLPSLLPGGRRVHDEQDRAEVAQTWEVPTLPDTPGRDLEGMLAAAAQGDMAALVVAGVDPDDCADPALVREALERTGFVVSLELRESALTQLADVVFPVAAVTEKAGSFMDWEQRRRPFAAALPQSLTWSDARVLAAVAEQMGQPWPAGCVDVPVAQQQMAALGSWGFGQDEPTLMPEAGQPAEGLAEASGQGSSVLLPPNHTPDAPLGAATSAPLEGGLGELGVDPFAQLGSEECADQASADAAGVAVLATWAQLIDAGRGQDFEPHLAATARPVVARLSATTAAGLGVRQGDVVQVRTDRGGITAPVAITDMPPGMVWLPTNSPGCQVARQLGATHGSPVHVARVAEGEQR